MVAILLLPRCGPDVYASDDELLQPPAYRWGQFRHCEAFPRECAACLQARGCCQAESFENVDSLIGVSLLPSHLSHLYMLYCTSGATILHYTFQLALKINQGVCGVICHYAAVHKTLHRKDGLPAAPRAEKEKEEKVERTQAQQRV